MAQLAGSFGLQLDPDPFSLFHKYFKGATGLITLERDFKSIWNQPLASCGPGLEACSVSFGEGITADIGATELTVMPGVQGTLSVTTTGNLFDPDPFGGAIEIPANHAYVDFGVTANVSLAPSGVIGGVTLGFEVATSVKLSNYRLFRTTATTPSIGSAIAETINGCIIPFHVADLSAMPAGLIAVLEGSGSIAFTASVDLATLVNPLATVSSEILNDSVQLQAGASIPITASIELSGDYQIRIRKLEDSKVELGYYVNRGSGFAISASASLGVSATEGTTSLIGSLISAISPEPAAGLKGLSLSPAEIRAVDDALKQAIDRELELGIQGQLGYLSSAAEAFLFEVDLGLLEPEGQMIVEEALHSNVTPLVEREKTLPVGITWTSSAMTRARERGFSLKINVFGLYNYASFGDLLANSTIATDGESGAVVITDSATASRIELTTNLLTDDNRMKLRSVLAESLLLTIVYRCGAMVMQPGLSAFYWFFDLDPFARREEIEDHLNALAALGLDVQHQPPDGLEDFGRTAFYLSTGYDDHAVRAIFLKPDVAARPAGEFSAAGRQAMQAVLVPGGVNDTRRLAVEDSYWPRVNAAAGNLATLAQIFPDAPQPALVDVFGDWFVISNWAAAMAGASRCIASALPWLSQDPDPKSPAFRSLRAILQFHIASMAKETRDRFAEPWGMVALDLASGRKSQASGALYSPAFTLVLKRQLPAAN